MRVILNQQEIEAAIENYILENVTVPDDNRIDIALKATRGDEGYTAEIDILNVNEPVGSRAVDEGIEPTTAAIEEGLGIVDKINAAKADATAPRRRGRPAGSKNKVPADTDTSVAAPVVQTEATTTAIEEHPAHEEAVTEEVQTEAQEEAPVATIEENLAAATELTAEADAIINDDPAPVEAAKQVEATEAVIPAEEEASKPAARPSLFGGPKPVPVDDLPKDEPVEPEAEIEAEPDANSEEALAAEAALTEPEAYVEEQVITEVPAALSADTFPAAKRSLFGDLKKPDKN